MSPEHQEVHLFCVGVFATICNWILLAFNTGKTPKTYKVLYS